MGGTGYNANLHHEVDPDRVEGEVGDQPPDLAGALLRQRQLDAVECVL